MIATTIPMRVAIILVVALAACQGATDDSAADDDAAPAERVEVEATSYAYNPATITVPGGTIRFVVHNASDIVHGFEVEGQGMEEEIAEIEPGATDSLTVTFESPGTYEIYCPVDDHQQRGMTGTLEVDSTTVP